MHRLCSCILTMVLNGSSKLLTLKDQHFQVRDFSRRKSEIAVKVSGEFCPLVQPHWIGLRGVFLAYSSLRSAVLHEEVASALSPRVPVLFKVVKYAILKEL